MHRIFQRKDIRKKSSFEERISTILSNCVLLYFYSFPDGKLDPCDLSIEWLEYLSSSINIDRFSKKIADIYKDIDHPYPGLAFRLCAIRETFEETGLLLAKSQTSSNSQ